MLAGTGPLCRGRQCPMHRKSAEGHHFSATALSEKMSGGVLLSHAVSHAVPSALKGLTSGFGMGPGVSPSLWPPKLYGDVISGGGAIKPVRRGRPHLGSRTVDASTFRAVRDLPGREKK